MKIGLAVKDEMGKPIFQSRLLSRQCYLLSPRGGLETGYLDNGSSVFTG
jgi:hypothetical protein